MLEQTAIQFDTRREALRRVATTIQETQAEILRFAFDRGPFGITADETAEHFDCDHNHTSPRISELLKRELLRHTGQTRPTRAGSSAAVLVHFEFAKEEDLG